MNRATSHPPYFVTPHTARRAARLFAALLVVIAIVVTFAHVQPTAAQDGGTTHTVQAGENLYRIALQYGLTVADLASANGISDPTRIYINQTLVIPTSDAPAAQAAAEPTGDGTPALHNASVNPAPDTSVYHTVQPGETLTSIAEQYGLGWQDVAAANGLGTPSHILVQQKLLIPVAAQPVSTEQPSQDAPAAVPEVPDQVAAINPAPAAQDLGILTPDTSSAPAAQNPASESDMIPDQVLAINPQTAVEDLGILDPATQTNTVNPAPAAQDLGIVSAPAQNAAANPAPAQATTNAAGERVHVVQAGEHLASIAARYGLSYPTLAMANNISNPNQIYSGQSLIIPDQDYAPASYVPQSTAPAQAAAPTITNGKQIVVDLSDQRVYAYENGQLLKNMLVSTGTAAFPTVQGDYKVYLKYESQTMSGPGYNLPGVPYVLYFYQGYSLHGTYWHSNFGTPMSHGCVNMYTPDAQWVWNWAPIGTPVHVQW